MIEPKNRITYCLLVVDGEELTEYFVGLEKLTKPVNESNKLAEQDKGSNPFTSTISLLL